MRACSCVEVDGETHQLEAGEEIVIPPTTPHVSYTESESVRFSREVTPPGQWREALTTRFAAVHAHGEPSGVTGLLKTVLLVRAYPEVVIPEQPPRPVQRVMFPVLAGAARLFGLQPDYQYPQNDPDSTEEHPDGTPP